MEMPYFGLQISTVISPDQQRYAALLDNPITSCKKTRLRDLISTLSGRLGDTLFSQIITYKEWEQPSRYSVDNELVLQFTAYPFNKTVQLKESDTMVHPKDYGTMQVISKEEMNCARTVGFLKSRQKRMMLEAIIETLGDSLVDYIITYEEYTDCNTDSTFYGDLVMRFTAHYRPVSARKE